MPLATTVNEALAPLVTVTLLGWVVMLGAVAAALTVNVAPLVVAEPAEFVTTQV